MKKKSFNPGDYVMLRDNSGLQAEIGSRGEVVRVSSGDEVYLDIVWDRRGSMLSALVNGQVDGTFNSKRFVQVEQKEPSLMGIVLIHEQVKSFRSELNKPLNHLRRASAMAYTQGEKDIRRALDKLFDEIEVLAEPVDRAIKHRLIELGVK